MSERTAVYSAAKRVGTIREGSREILRVSNVSIRQFEELVNKFAAKLGERTDARSVVMFTR